MGGAKKEQAINGTQHTSPSSQKRDEWGTQASDQPKDQKQIPFGNDNKKTVVFHDNFCQMGGAERQAELIHQALAVDGPVALRSTLSAVEILTPYLQRVGIRNTWMQRLPARAKLFRAYFLLYPFAVDHVDLKEYDVIVSSCFGYAKGVRKRPGAVHVCYCYTPMRWVWRKDDYLAREKNSRLKSALLALPLKWLKRWELRAAKQPDKYIAISGVVAARLKSAFGVDSTVIFPGIDTKRFAPLAGHENDAPEDFYLLLSRLVPYKRFDLAILACVALGRQLVVIGDGPDRARLEAMAAGAPNIRFLGRAPDEVVGDHARRTRALLFPGEEDFGMTPLEINAAGRPVVAFRGGGTLDTVVDGLNGVFFEEPTAESLAAAIVRLEGMEWNAAAIRRHADGFSVERFQERIREFVAGAKGRFQPR
jgi:glycosyltransferase involved in cell wall biosynthesis